MAAEYDRDTLEGFVDRYLEALVAGDPERLRVTEDVVFVENHQRLALGDGLWRTVTGVGAYRHYIADRQRGQVVLIGVVEERDTSVIFEVRLAIENDLIDEIETLVIRANAAQYETQGTPDPRFLETVPAEEQLSRERLIAVADKYFTGMEGNDPDDAYGFFHPDCDRWEHARKVTNREEGIPYGHIRDTEFTTLSAREQFETGFLGFVTRIRDRRYVAVDVERQTVFAFGFFDHNGTVREVPGPGDEPSTVPPYFSTPRTLPIGEAFRIKDGRIYMIEATLTEAPYGIRPVFPSADDWLAQAAVAPEIASAPAAGPTDRPWLEQLVGEFREALADNDAGRLPVAPSVIYTENGQRLPLNDGLWGSVTALGEYDLRLADPEHGVAGFYGTTVEHDVPGVLAARLAVEDRRITEIEAVIVRREIAVDGPENTQTMFLPMLPHQNDPADFEAIDPVLAEEVPAEDRKDRGALLAITDSYYDSLRGKPVSSEGYAEGCVRRVNGVDVGTGPPEPGDEWIGTGIETVRDVRPWLVDPNHGLVMRSPRWDVPNDDGGRSMAVGEDATTQGDDEGFGGTYSSFTGPYSLLTVQLFAVRDGRIVHIEAQRRTVPYRMGSGWD